MADIFGIDDIPYGFDDYDTQLHQATVVYGFLFYFYMEGQAQQWMLRGTGLGSE